MKYRKLIKKIIYVEIVEEAIAIIKKITPTREKKVKSVFHLNLKHQVELMPYMN